MVENELIHLTKNTSDKINLLKNAKINGLKSQKNLEIATLIITLLSIFDSLVIFKLIFLIMIIIFKLNTDYVIRFNIIDDLINEYKEQIKEEEEYKNKLVAFKKKYLSNLITTLQTTQKNMNDDIKEEIDSLKKDIKDLDNT